MSEQVFPASFSQQRLWFLDQVIPGTTAYNLARAFRLSGSLDAVALASALQSIISRHASLRTVFISLDEEVKQVAAARAAEMRVAEAHDGVIGDVVPGAPVPAVVEGVGAELHGAEGHRRTGKAVSVTACADHGIDPHERIISRSRSGGGG